MSSDEILSVTENGETAPVVEPRTSARVLGEAGAAFVGVFIGALVNVPFVVKSARDASASAGLAVALDAVQFATAGLLAAAVLRLWLITPRRRFELGLALLFVFAVAVGFPLLGYDLENFSERHAERVPAWLIRTLLTVGIAASVPAALVAGRWACRGRAGRAVAVLAAVGAFAANGVLLVRDYHGIHFYLAWSAATLAGAALVGLPLGRWREWTPFGRRQSTQIALLAGLALLTLGALLLWKPSARVASALSRSGGSVFAPLVSRARARLAKSEAGKAAGTDPWLKSRAKHPAIAPSQPALLPRDAIVVLLTVDALRADIVNSGKYDARIPNLVKLRDSGVTFTNARSASSVTRLSIASMFMGTYFLQQYWTKKKDHFTYMPMKEDSVRFTELLRDAKVDTATLTSMKWMRNALGIVRGFEREKHVPPHEKVHFTPSEPVFDRMLPLLQKAGPGPLFFFSHLSDTHSPYDLGGTQGTAFERYVGEAEYFDRSLGRLLALFEDPAFARRCTLILSADHGEEFLEHGSTDHGTTLYEEVVRVPLILRAPGVAARRVEEPVSLIDLGPTILDLYGLDTPGHFMGQSLTPFLRGNKPVLTRPIISETRGMISYVTRDGLKAVFDTKTNHVEVYDLVADPHERKNQSDDEALSAQALSYVKTFHEVHRLRLPGYERPDVR